LLQIINWNRLLPEPIKIGSLEDVRIGLDTHAIGHPGGEYWTYTRGYISQFRPNYEWSYEDGERFTADVVQTQTPINPGNSGGPLVNENGKLVGVNSFKGDGEGINFAVAFTEIEKFLERAPAQSPEKQKSICQADLVAEYRSKKDDGAVMLYDRDCNGIPDLSLYRPDSNLGDTIIDHDDNEDSRVDGTIIDKGSDGHWNYSFWDADFDGEFDLEGIHPDGEINPSSFKEIS
jgi:S1-C subfamily serine protease